MHIEGLRGHHSFPRRCASGALALAVHGRGLALVRARTGAVRRLRRRLADVREGTERQLRGTYPTEVQPLVDDLNALLDHRERTGAAGRSRRPATSRTG